jgi:hypothetical protein
MGDLENTVSHGFPIGAKTGEELREPMSLNAGGKETWDD